MRRQWWTRGLYILIAAALLTGLGGCSRPAAERAPEDFVIPQSDQVEATARGAQRDGTATVVSALSTAEVIPWPEGTGAPTVVAVPTIGESWTVSETAPITATETQGTSGSQEGMDTPEPTAKAQVDASDSAGSSRPQGNKPGQDCRWKHKVKKGEWVWQIAREYGVNPNKILKANGLTRKKATIHPGEVLCIP